MNKKVLKVDEQAVDPQGKPVKVDTPYRETVGENEFFGDEFFDPDEFMISEWEVHDADMDFGW